MTQDLSLLTATDHHQMRGDTLYLFNVERSVPDHLENNSPVTIERAVLAGDELRLDVSYLGGCGEHGFALRWRPVGNDALVDASLELQHDATELCQDNVLETLVFDLSPLRDELPEQFVRFDAVDLSAPQSIQIEVNWRIPLYEELRQRLIETIWGDNGMPVNFVPARLERDQSDPLYDEMAGLDRIDILEFEVDYDLRSMAYHFHPSEPNNRLLIYHQGHLGDFSHGLHTIEFFVERGYSVMAFSMPLLGPNQGGPVQLPSGETVYIWATTSVGHLALEQLEVAGLPTFSLFVDPLVQALNYVDVAYNFDYVNMIGISGGGWTTTLLAAIDTRIDQSYPVAGSLPPPPPPPPLSSACTARLWGLGAAPTTASLLRRGLFRMVYSGQPRSGSEPAPSSQRLRRLLFSGRRT